MSATSWYLVQQLVALGIVAALFVALRARVLGITAQGKHKSVLTGADGRWSTSRFSALLWSAVLAYMLVALVVVGVTEQTSSPELAQKFDQVDGVYLALLGGPFAAFLLAKVAVQQKTGGETPSLQKTTAQQPTAGDVVQGDTGNTDVVDFQYVLFNVIAAGYVASLFVPHPGTGVPDVPTALAVLTGGSALTYVTNKAVASNAPQVTAMAPTSVAAGAIVAVYGSHLQAPGQTEDSRVLVGGVQATIQDAESARITFTAPAATGEHVVEVVTGAGLKAPVPGTLKIG